MKNAPAALRIFGIFSTTFATLSSRKRTYRLKELTRPSLFGSILVALARSREIRTLKNLRCELSLWPLTFLNYTKMTKYEALEKNAVSEPEMPQLGDLHYSRNSRKPHFIGRFSTYSLMEKLGCLYEWRRERNWGRTFST
jgi:hypothetical protein